jgi:hypothetical protein
MVLAVTEMNSSKVKENSSLQNGLRLHHASWWL